MALLIDEMRQMAVWVESMWDQDGILFQASGKVKKYADMVQDLMAEASGKSVVRATNISQWVLSEYDGREIDYDSLECCMPPFPEMWLEWISPFVPGDCKGSRMGCVVVSTRDETESGWVVAMLPAFVCNSEHKLGLTRLYVVCVIDQDGRWTGVFAKDSFSGEALQMGTVPWDDRNILMYSAFVVLQTFCFMNCSGVREQREEPSGTPMQKKWNRKAEKEGGKPLPLVSFTTVDIGPLFTRGRKNGKSEPTGRHNREHWTRGHVKRYPGLLLFGRVKLEKPGVWCPAFKSGRAKGEVKHAEYNVTIPERNIDLRQGAA